MENLQWLENREAKCYKVKRMSAIKT